MNKNKIYDLLSEGNVTDAVSVLLEELEGPELDNHAKELENEATKESKPEVISKEVGNKEVYPSDEHKEKEDVKEVVVESEQVAAGPELKEPKELENEATEPSKPEELKSDLDNEDVYPEDEHLDAEEVEEAIVESIEVYNYLMESTDEEFAALMESFDEDEYEYCEYLLSEDFENLLIESEVLNESGYITLDEGRRWEKFKKGAKKVLKYGAGAATIGGAGAAGYQVGKHGVKAVGGAIKSGLKAAGGYLGAGSVASTAGGALAGAALGAGAIYAGKKIAQKIKKEKDITNRLNQKGETEISLDGKKTETYDYRNRKNRRKVELIRNKYAHADKLSQAKAELKKAKRGSDDTAYENAKKSLKDAKTQYKADKANIKYKDKLKAKLARLEAAKELEDEKYPKEVKKEEPKEVVKEKPEEPKKEVVEKQEEPKEVVKESYELPLLESTDFELMQWLHENNFVPSFSNVNELRLIMEEMEVNEDILDSNPEAEKAEENFETPEKFAPTADETADEMDKLLSVSPVEEVELSESMKSIFSILDRINEGAQVAAGPELKEPKELKNEATDENKKEEVAEDKDNKDVYPSDEHREAEEVEEVIIENVINDINEYGSVVLEGVDVEELDALYTVLSEALFKVGEGDRQQQIQKDAVKKVDIARRRAVSSANTFNKKAGEAWNLKKGAKNLVGRAVAGITRNKQKLDELRNERATGKHEKEKYLNRAAGALKGYNTSVERTNNTRVQQQQEQNQKSLATQKSKLKKKGVNGEELNQQLETKRQAQTTGEHVGGTQIKKRNWFERTFSKNKSMYESYDILTNDEWLDLLEENGYEPSMDNLEVVFEAMYTDYLYEEVDNVATEEKSPETMEQEVDNKDVYSAPEHKEVEDVVEVVVEAAKLCSENGVPATLANITKYAKTLFESEGVALNVGKPEEKEYDADADIESAEMNGNKEEFEKYEDIQGEGAKAAKAEESIVEPKDLHESVNYTSLREACLLDESYFSTDSYTIQTADEKVEKLTEQVSLLLAREAMDPLYEELLTTSIKAQRLQEACAKKYRKLAEDKVTRISKRLPR